MTTGTGTTITAEEFWVAIDDDAREELTDYLELVAGVTITEVIEATFGEGTLRVRELVPIPGGYAVDGDELVVRTTYVGSIPLAPPTPVLEYILNRNRAHQ